MKLSFLALALVILAGIPHIAKATDTKSTATKSTITAVSFHSDTCGSCKILDPKIKDAMNAINKDKIDMVKLDFTNKDTIEQSKALANEKGLNDILQQYGSRTGFIVLVNAEGKEVDKLKVDDSTADIAAKVAKAIASAS